MAESRGTRIVFVNSFPGPGMGGGEVQLAALARACLDAGMKVTVVCAHGSGLVGELARDDVVLVEVGFSPAGLLGALRRIRSVLRGRDVRILQGTGFLTNLVTRVAAWDRAAIVVVNAVHVEPGASLHDGGSRIGLALRGLLERATGRRVDRYVAVSRSVARALETRWGVDPRKIRVVPNGIDPEGIRALAAAPSPALATVQAAALPSSDAGESIHRPAEGAPVGADLSMGHERERALLVGVVGRLEPVKGVAEFLRAAEIVSHQRGDLVYLIAGTGSQEEPLLRLAAELEIGDRVRFLGHVSPVAPLVAQLAVLVIPSYSEGLPMSALEAMALGVPVVATDVGGIPEVVEPNATGWLVPAGRPDALAAVILSALSDPARAKEIAAAARRRVEDEFTLPRMAGGYLSVYGEELRRRSS